MKKLYIYIFFAFIISSCDDFESVIDLEIPNHQPLLVLNGVLDTDTTRKSQYLTLLEHFQMLHHISFQMQMLFYIRTMNI